MNAIDTPVDPALPLADRLRDALDLLEAIDADRGVLDALPEADRVRLHQVVARIFHPEPKARRQMLKKLRVYAGPDHKHEAQQPEVLVLK